MLKRYLPFYKAGAINTMAYKFNLFIWLIVSVFEVACVVFLWFAVYSNSPDGMDSVINGYSFKEMITYLVTVNIFWFCTSNSNTLWTIDDEIKNGTIAMAFTKPISYRKRFVFTTLGIASMQFALVGLPLFVISYTVFVLIGFISVASVGVLLADHCPFSDFGGDRRSAHGLHQLHFRSALLLHQFVFRGEFDQGSDCLFPFGNAFADFLFSERVFDDRVVPSFCRNESESRPDSVDAGFSR